MFLRTEIHASELIRIKKITEYKRIVKRDRINLLKDYSNEIPIIFDDTKIINVCFDKNNLPVRDFQELAWKRMIQRYDTYLKKEANDYGIIVSDTSDGKLIRNLLRKMRIYNPIKSDYGGYYQAPIEKIVEDVFSRDSEHSYFIQTVDVITQILYRREYPKGSLKKHGIHLIFDKLQDICLKEASRKDELGIVRN